MSYPATKKFVEYTLQNFLILNMPEWVFNPPLVKTNQSDKPRVDIRVEDGKGYRTNIGRRYFERVPGMVIMELTISPEQKIGTKLIDDATEMLKKLFQDRGVRLNDDQSVIKFSVSSWEIIGDIGNRYQHRILTPYERQEPAQLVQDTTFL